MGSQREDFDNVDLYTNHDVVEKAFEVLLVAHCLPSDFALFCLHVNVLTWFCICVQECDLNHEGRLTYEEFKMYGKTAVC